MNGVGSRCCHKIAEKELKRIEGPGAAMRLVESQITCSQPAALPLAPIHPGQDGGTVVPTTSLAIIYDSSAFPSGFLPLFFPESHIASASALRHLLWHHLAMEPVSIGNG